MLNVVTNNIPAIGAIGMSCVLFKNSAYFVSALALRATSAALESIDCQELANEAKQNYNKYLGYSAKYMYQNRNALAVFVASTTIFGVAEGSLAPALGPYAMYLGKALSLQKGLLYFSLAAQLAQGTRWCYARMKN